MLGSLYAEHLGCVSLVPDDLELSPLIVLPTRRRELEALLPIRMVGVIPKCSNDDLGMIANAGSIVVIDVVSVPSTPKFPAALQFKQSGKIAVLVRPFNEDKSVLVMKCDSADAKWIFSGVVFEYPVFFISHPEYHLVFRGGKIIATPVSSGITICTRL